MAKRLTTEDFIERATIVHGDKYDYSKVVYINNKTKAEIICKKHGSFWQSWLLHVNRGYGCPACNSSKKKTTNEFIVEAAAAHNGKYDYSKTVYENNATKVEITCKTHGEFFQTPAKHICSKRGCPQCAIDSFRLTTNEFIAKANKVHNNRYDYSLVKYENCYSKITIICPEHGKFKQIATGHLHGKGNCPRCQDSKGEIKIAKYLDDLKIKYEREFWFNDCIDINKLRFDFFLPSQNIAIEYDGEQHFKIIKYFGGIKHLKETQKHDAIKNKYCKDNGIRLIRISYKKLKKIDEILDSIFVT